VDICLLHRNLGRSARPGKREGLVAHGRAQVLDL